MLLPLYKASFGSPNLPPRSLNRFAFSPGPSHLLLLGPGVFVSLLPILNVFENKNATSLNPIDFFISYTLFFPLLKIPQMSNYVLIVYVFKSIWSMTPSVTSSSLSSKLFTNRFHHLFLSRGLRISSVSSTCEAPSFFKANLWLHRPHADHPLFLLPPFITYLPGPIPLCLNIFYFIFLN